MACHSETQQTFTFAYLPVTVVKLLVVGFQTEGFRMSISASVSGCTIEMVDPVSASAWQTKQMNLQVMCNPCILLRGPSVCVDVKKAWKCSSVAAFPCCQVVAP